MNSMPTIALTTGLALSISLVGPLAGQGRHIPIHPTAHPAVQTVQTVSTRVSAQLTNGVADTLVTLSFRNNSNRITEKVILFPLPKGATADRIRMKIGDKMEAGEVLDKNQAREIYEGIVRKRMDPALLEYMGRDLLRLRVFPIPAHGTQDVEVRFRMLLPEGGGLYGFEFPTRAVEGGTFSMDIQIRSKTAIKNIWSPVQGFEIKKKSDHEARASYECKGRPTKDPVLFYGLSDRDFGLNLLTWRKRGEPGYFMVLLAPKRDWKQEKELNKDIIFVLDTSGSMQGQKIVQARAAVDFFLKSLKPGDRFNLIPFSTEARPFAAQSLPADKRVLEKAFHYVKSLEARGGTNIDEALNAAFAGLSHKDLGNAWLPKDDFYAEVCPPDAVKRVPILVFLTDGLPTVGLTDVRALLAKARTANQAKARIFVFGVGNDVNTRLLDKMALGSRGDRDYVAPGENIEVKTSLLFEKLAYPVLTDLELRADKVQWARQNPSRLPDLFRGSRLILTGRYTGSGATAIRLSGKVAGEVRKFVFEGNFPEAQEGNDFIPTIWAQRRVAQLLDAIRLNGRSDELIHEIKVIGKQFGIVTPYTSQLILEDGAALANNLPSDTRRRLGGGFAFDRDRLAGDLKRAGELQDDEELEGLEAKVKKEKSQGRSTPARTVALPSAQSGEKAVDASKSIHLLRNMGAIDSRRNSRLVTTKRIHGKFFHLIGSTWVDRDFKKGMADKKQAIEAFSKPYFELLATHPRAARWLAFSTSVLIIIDDRVWLIQPPKQASK